MMVQITTFYCESSDKNKKQTSGILKPVVLSTGGTSFFRCSQATLKVTANVEKWSN
jgi:hypothetical protein